MKGLAILVAGLWLLLFSGLCLAQQAEAPTYKDGDWWKLKSELESRKERSTVSCDVNYPEYVVMIVQGKPKVYGVKGSNKDEIDCPIVSFRLLGIGNESSAKSSADSDETDEWNIHYLNFPMTVGQTWASRIEEQQTKKASKGARSRWADLGYKVVGWEKVPTPVGELDAFKIEVSGWRHGHLSYYYSPSAKSIIRLRLNTAFDKRTVSVVDFKVSP